MLHGTAAPSSVLSLWRSSLLTVSMAPPERVEKRAHLCLWCTCGEGAAFPRDLQRCGGGASANTFLGSCSAPPSATWQMGASALAVVAIQQQLKMRLRIPKSQTLHQRINQGLV